MRADLPDGPSACGNFRVPRPNPADWRPVPSEDVRRGMGGLEYRRPDRGRRGWTVHEAEPGNRDAKSLRQSFQGKNCRSESKAGGKSIKMSRSATMLLRTRRSLSARRTALASKQRLDFQMWRCVEAVLLLCFFSYRIFILAYDSC